MKNRNLLGLAVLLLLMAALFFGSVMCPPASERAAAETAAAAASQVDPAPPLARNDALAEPLRDATPGTEAPAVNDVLVRVTDMDGRPLLGAEIMINWADRPGAGVAARGHSDVDGLWLFQRLPNARYRVHAVASGYFPSAQHEEVLIPALTRPELTLPLERGGLITGFVFGLDGAARPFGWLRFQDLDRGTQVLVRSDERGAFTSGPLRRGAWEVSWLKHEQAEADPRLKWTVVNEPGAVAELLVTVDEVGPGREARAGRAVGIVPNSRGG